MLLDVDLEPLCASCLCKYGRGKPHECTPTTWQQNLLKLSNNNAEKIVASVVKNNYKHVLSVRIFRKKYLDLQILQVTPKIHCVFFHCTEFIDRRKSSPGRWSEQAPESVHADFKKTWSWYKVPPDDHPDYGDHLLYAVCAFDSMYR